MQKGIIVMTAVLFIITVIDVFVAINNIMTNNVATGILLIVMAVIIFAAAVRNILILIKKR